MIKENLEQLKINILEIDSYCVSLICTLNFIINFIEHVSQFIRLFCFLLEYNFDQYSIFQYLIRLLNTNYEMYHVYKINFSSKQYQCKLNCFMFLVVSHLFLLNLILKYISCQMSRQSFHKQHIVKNHLQFMFIFFSLQFENFNVTFFNFK